MNQEYAEYVASMSQEERIVEMRSVQSVKLQAAALWNQMPAADRQEILAKIAVLQKAISANQPPPTLPVVPPHPTEEL